MVMQMVINHFCFLVRSTRWLVDKVCSARADVATSPFHKARLCTARRCLRHWTVGVLCIAITDEGSRRLSKFL